MNTATLKSDWLNAIPNLVTAISVLNDRYAKANITFSGQTGSNTITCNFPPEFMPTNAFAKACSDVVSGSEKVKDNNVSFEMV